MLAKGFAGVAKDPDGVDWQPFFDPRGFVKSHQDLSLEAFALSEDQLQEFGVQATSLRDVIMKQAKDGDDKSLGAMDEVLAGVNKIGETVRQRGTTSGKSLDAIRTKEFMEPVPQGSRKKSRKGKPIRTNEKIEIIYKVVVEQEKQKDVAREHRVTPARISQLVSKARKHKGFMAEILSTKETRQDKRDSIRAIVEDLVAKHVFISSA